MQVELTKFKERIFHNLKPEVLTKRILENENSYLTKKGVVGVFTGKRSSRSPNDRYIVYGPGTQYQVAWGEYNQPMQREVYDRILTDVLEYLYAREAYIFDGIAGRDERNDIDIRVISDMASQAMFCDIMFRPASTKEKKAFVPGFTVLSSPNLKLKPAKYGIRSEAAIIINFEERVIIVVGTGYSCEIKKAIFSVFNFLMPQQNVLCMHCSANSLPGGKNSALFFGLSGTGKTTLSNSATRNVVGDDQHGWNDYGIFNIENGCYAKVYGLDKDKEPEIYNAIKRGAMIENVPFNVVTQEPDYKTKRVTENTRAIYPVTNLTNVELSGVAEHPKNIFFLTADSMGLFPPISLLSKEQAKYYFLSGFTSKMGGTENKIAEPELTFSSCFGAPFLPLRPIIYGQLLLDKIEQHGCNVWLVNTGWTGGIYGAGGTRISLKSTRALVDAATNGKLIKQEFETEKYFGLSIPKECAGVDSKILNPVKAWKSKKEYEKNVAVIKKQFIENFSQFEGVDESIRKAGPKL
ncbi:MAG: phosphoenolpyruvate carboxykinase (ATP) [Firmicutes bacterium]|nr:phosphoenolpyruvate carboxykinase (ATP) [Bacillota bacterium]